MGFVFPFWPNVSFETMVIRALRRSRGFFAHIVNEPKVLDIDECPNGLTRRAPFARVRIARPVKVESPWVVQRVRLRLSRSRHI